MRVPLEDTGLATLESEHAVAYCSAAREGQRRRIERSQRRMHQVNLEVEIDSRSADSYSCYKSKILLQRRSRVVLAGRCHDMHCLLVP